MADSDAIHAVPGVQLAAVSAGIKTPGRLDLVLLELHPESAVAAVFTRNAFCAAPVHVAREHLAAATPRYLLINTGNANAGTGASGMADARACCQLLSEKLSCAPEQVLPFSTGVIGEPLPVDKIAAAIPELQPALGAAHWPQAGVGILTTDTRAKLATRQFELEGHTVTISGMAKGAGMLCPNMATMLSYVATDLAVEPALLQKIWGEVVDKSFNRISVDGDTSTNDAAVMIATGRCGGEGLQSEHSPVYADFCEQLESLMIELAQGLVRDGEGASKFVEVCVTGGRDEAECLQVAYTIAHSPLVKTALFASDPNWGRLLAAIGRAGLDDLDVDQVALFINAVLIAEGGCRAPGYSEEQGAAAMEPHDIMIEVKLNRGDAQAQVWTSDFSYDYVRINAEYRT